MTSGAGAFDALLSYLSATVPEFNGPVEITPLSHGQSNPTYLLRSPTHELVLRRQPDGPLLRSAHAVDREYRVQKALEGSSVPVARMIALCTDKTVMGTMFYLMERVHGQIFWDPALPELPASRREQVYHAMATGLAAIHEVDIEAVGLADFGRPSGYFERQLARWSGQYVQDNPDRIPELDALIGWLEAHLPEDDGQSSLVHGDYRIDNLMFCPQTLDLLAVFDWELSTLGHPLADLAYQVMQRSMGRDWHLPGLEGVDCAALGIPSEDAYVATYCAARGLKSIDNWHYAKVFAFFRFAAICEGVGRRARLGTSVNVSAPKVGAMARPLAKKGLALAQSGN